jgi:hypothetical protein
MDTSHSDASDVARPADAAASPLQFAQPEFLADADPYPPEVVAKLFQSVDPADVEVKDIGQGRSLLYVPWIKYQDRLLDAFGPGNFRMVPTAPHRKQENDMTWTGALLVRIPGQRNFQFVKSAVGECGMRGGMSYPNAVEGAQSDCLVKCCKALGIYKELWDPTWRRAWEARYAGAHKQDIAKAAWPAERVAPEAKEKAPKAVASAKPSPVAATASAAPVAPASLPLDSEGQRSAAKEAAPAAGKVSASGLSPSAAQETASGPVVSAAPSPIASPGSVPAARVSSLDPGEPASRAQKEEVAHHVRSLKWTRGYFKEWLGKFTEAAGDRVETLDALTAKQADAVLAAFA